MKFLGLNNIIKTNILFSRLAALNPQRTLEIEAYSCKQTKEQKRHKKMSKPLRFFVSALELAFQDHDFSDESHDSFLRISLDELQNEMAFVFFILYKNNEDVAELVQYLDILLAQCIDITCSDIYSFHKSILYDSNSYRCFIIHDRKKKRVVIVKSIQAQ